MKNNLLSTAKILLTVVTANSQWKIIGATGFSINTTRISILKKIVLLTFLFASFTMNSQIILWEDDFNSYTPGDNVGEDIDVPADYLNYDVDADGYGWGLSHPDNFDYTLINDLYDSNFIISASYIGFGTNGNGGQGPVFPNNILVLPMINIPGNAADVNLTYYVACGPDMQFFAETYSVTVTTSNDETDILAATPILTDTLDFFGGEEASLNLDTYIGQNVYISFRHYDTTDQFVLGLDNIKVTAGVLGVTDSYFNDFKYFVDDNDQLNVAATFALEKIDLYNVLGQKVFAKSLSNTSEIIDISAITSGTYIATVTIEGQSKSFRIVKI